MSQAFAAAAALARVEAITTGTITINAAAASATATLTGWANARTVVFFNGSSTTAAGSDSGSARITQAASGADTVVTATRGNTVNATTVAYVAIRFAAVG